MASISPFREADVKEPEALRRGLNTMVRALNESSVRVQVVKLGSVQADQDVALANPGYSVGAVLVGAVNATAGAAAPTAAPFVANWVQQMDGRITCRIGGLAAFPALYAVSLVLIENEEASR